MIKATILTLLLLSSQAFAQVAPNYETAINMAKTEQKPIILTVVSSTCPWCKKLQNETFKDKKISDIMQNKFVTLILNKDTDKIPQGLNTKLVPVTYFLNAKGEKISKPAIGFFDASEFEPLLNEALKK